MASKVKSEGRRKEREQARNRHRVMVLANEDGSPKIYKNRAQRRAEASQKRKARKGVAQ